MAYKTRIQKTPLLIADEIQKRWFIVDAKGQILGRLAANIARVLRGKHKSTFTPHMDVGDFVIVINAGHVRLTGKKMDQKEFRWYTGYPGGLRMRRYRDFIKENAVKAVQFAVWGMLPHNRLGRRLLRKLKVYTDINHPHQAQKPEPLEL